MEQCWYLSFFSKVMSTVSNQKLNVAAAAAKVAIITTLDRKDKSHSTET